MPWLIWCFPGVGVRSGLGCGLLRLRGGFGSGIFLVEEGFLIVDRLDRQCGHLRVRNTLALLVDDHQRVDLVGAADHNGFTRFEPFGDTLRVAVGRTQFDAPCAQIRNLAAVGHLAFNRNIDELAAVVVHDTRSGNARIGLFSGFGQNDFCDPAGIEKPVGIFKFRPDLQCIEFGDLVVNEADPSFSLILLVVGELDFDLGFVPQPVGRLEEGDVIGFGNGEADVDRVDLRDGDQCAVARGNVVSLREDQTAGAPFDRGIDFRVGKVELGDIDLRFGEFQLPFGVGQCGLGGLKLGLFAVEGCQRVIDVVFGPRAPIFEELLAAGVVRFGVFDFRLNFEDVRLILLDCRFAGDHLGLGGAQVGHIFGIFDLEQERPLIDERPFCELDFFQNTRNAGDHVEHFDRFGGSAVFSAQRGNCFLNIGDQQRCNGERRAGRRLPERGGNAGEQAQNHQKTETE